MCHEKVEIKTGAQDGIASNKWISSITIWQYYYVSPLEDL